MKIIKLEVPSDDKFGKLYSFHLESLFNRISNSEDLIKLCLSFNYNFPESLDLYIDDVESFIDCELVECIWECSEFAFVRCVSLHTCVVPVYIVNNL